MLRYLLVLFAVGALGAADWRRSVGSSFREMSNPYLADRQSMGRGPHLYKDYCADCHGKRGSGTAIAPSLRSHRVAEARPGELLWLLRNGAGARKMPSFSFLGERETWALVEFLRQLR